MVISTDYEVTTTTLTLVDTTMHCEYLNKMEKFSAFFGQKISHLIFSATEKLSLAFQGRNTTLEEPAKSVNLAVRVLQNQQNDDTFDCFYSKIVEDSKYLTSEPAL